MPEEGVAFAPHGEILTYEEMLHVVRLAVRHGIRKVRLTGGEPLVRKDVIGFIETLCRMGGLHEITLTTNGVLLKEFARALRDCGICRINVSMDTLKADRFRRITRRDCFDRVWQGIEAAEAAGLHPIKINVVAMRGVNHDEVTDFARLTYRKPYHVRFIELMPLGAALASDTDKFLPVEEIFQQIRSLGMLTPIRSGPLDGPSRRFTLAGAQGEIGLIGALSHHFCDHCNRLRLTADGRLRGCLFSDREIDIKAALRRDESDDRLSGLIKAAINSKPKDHGLLKPVPRKCVRPMNRIGG
jgi:cyclic pyranopterin phosphate synthase